MTKMKLRMTCGTCGSTNVKHDAWAAWDEDAQEWILDNTFDYAHCEDCEQETTIEAVKIPAEVMED